MAITRHSKFDVTVANIAARNALLNKVNHMCVVVTNAIDDPGVALNQKAIYRYDSNDDIWILISNNIAGDVTFETEEVTITNGIAESSYYIIDNQIWNVTVLDGDIIMAELRPEEYNVNLNNISGLENYEGNVLKFTYAHGSNSEQINKFLKAIDPTYLTYDDVINDLETI